MRVFLSWSGERSRVVAEALRDWLPSVIQTIKPWMSSHDIDAGSRWSDRVGAELQKSDFGILCVTPENVEAPWLLFEAGALSRTLDVSKVCPLLMAIRPADLVGPLAQFQAIESNHDQLLKLLKTINRLTAENQLGEQQLVETFELWWPKLHPRLQAATDKPIATRAQNARRPVEDMVAELLALVREQSVTLNAPLFDLPFESAPTSPESVSLFKTGQRVEHLQFGHGTISATSLLQDGDQKIVVNFATVGSKTLRARFAKLRLLDGPAGEGTT